MNKHANWQISISKSLGDVLPQNFDLDLLITSDHNFKISNQGAQLHIFFYLNNIFIQKRDWTAGYKPFISPPLLSLWLVNTIKCNGISYKCNT